MKAFFSLCIFVSLFNSVASATTIYDKFSDKTFRKIDNSLTIHLIPSTYPLNWTTPRSLLFSIIKNKYFFPKTNHFIGHVSAELNCTINGKKERLFMGQSSNSLNGFKDFILQGYGFSILNMPTNNYDDVPLLTVPGKLDQVEGSSQHFDDLISSDVFGLISFRIKQKDCEATAEFMKEYRQRTLNNQGAGNNYGFGADPIKFQGAGCAPFVQTLFETSQLFDFAKEMNQVVYLPNSLLGNPKNGKKIGLWTLLTSNLDMSVKNKKARTFSFPDPQLLFEKMKNIHSGREQASEVLVQKGLIGNSAPYVILDMTLSTN